MFVLVANYLKVANFIFEAFKTNTIHLENDQTKNEQHFYFK